MRGLIRLTIGLAIVLLGACGTPSTAIDPTSPPSQAPLQTISPATPAATPLLTHIPSTTGTVPTNPVEPTNRPASTSKPAPSPQSTAVPPAAEPTENTVVRPGGIAPLGDTCPTDAPIKGNIDKNGAKIYYVPSAEVYSQTKPEQCFETEAEAQAAGFSKALQ